MHRPSSLYLKLFVFFSNSWCEWHEDNVDADETRVVCLLCHESDDTAEGLLDHMKVWNSIRSLVKGLKIDLNEQIGFGQR